MHALPVLFDFVTWGIPMSTDWEQGQRVLDMANDALLDKNKKRALETVSPSLNGTDHQAAISSAHGTKVLNNLATRCENSATQPKTFIGEVAKPLAFHQKGSRIRAACMPHSRRRTGRL